MGRVIRTQRKGASRIFRSGAAPTTRGGPRRVGVPASEFSEAVCLPDLAFLSTGAHEQPARMLPHYASAFPTLLGSCAAEFTRQTSVRVQDGRIAGTPGLPDLHASSSAHRSPTFFRLPCSRHRAAAGRTPSSARARPSFALMITPSARGTSRPGVQTCSIWKPARFRSARARRLGRRVVPYACACACACVSCRHFFAPTAAGLIASCYILLLLE